MKTGGGAACPDTIFIALASLSSPASPQAIRTNQITPIARMASATRTKPVMFAPST